MGKVVKEVWDIDGIAMPVYIYKERRYNNRISITKKGANLRVPSFGLGGADTSYRKWAEDWLRKQLNDRPDIAQRYSSAQYQTGYKIETPVKIYTLYLENATRATSSGKLIGGNLFLKLNDQINEIERAATIRTLIARLVGKDQLKRVTNRINEINEQCFSQSIKSVRIKNNSSNWGSCSTTGNINISAKTLLAPLIVQDYIFVHELAHRIEMNHSPEYWAIVKKVMPRYEEQELWIKENGHLCEF